MRALRRVATPVAVILTGCSFPVDEFRDPANTKADVGLRTNQDTASEDDDGADAGAKSDTDVAKPDTRSDACVCVKTAGPYCKEWSPPDCGK